MKKSSTIFPLLAIAALLMGCEQGERVPMPRELVGIWRTSMPPYEDRFMEVTPQHVRFGNDAEGGVAHPVDEVREFPAAGAGEYQITYLSDEGLEYLLSLSYDRSEQVVRLTNQPQMVWKRTAVFD